MDIYKTIEKGGSNQNKNNPNTKIEVDLNNGNVDRRILPKKFKPQTICNQNIFVLQKSSIQHPVTRKKSYFPTSLPPKMRFFYKLRLCLIGMHVSSVHDRNSVHLRQFVLTWT